jgi:phosphatidylglycerol:prolipoprotein diacylglycerol transferase
LRPTLFTVAGLPLHSYGLAIALGFTLGVVVAARQARRVGLDSAAFVDLLFWILVWGIGGSRLAFVLLHAGHYFRLCASGTDCLAPLKLWEGGLVFHGGALAAAGAVLVFSRRRGWRFPQVADVLAPALALGHCVGRLGCFLAGCCYGKPWAWGVSFPRGSVAADELAVPRTPPLHPVQLYEAAGELAIFVALILLRRRPRPEGTVALSYAVLYGVLRFAVELFRGDPGRGFVAPWLSVAQLVSILLAVSAAALLFRRRPASGRTAPAPGR